MGTTQSGSETSVSAPYFGALVEHLANRGFQAKKTSPLIACDLHSPLMRVSGARFSQLLVESASELGDLALGLRFGASVGGAGFGLLGVATVSALTLRSSIQSLIRLASLTTTFARIDVVVDERTITLRWKPHIEVPPQVVEGILSGWVSFGRFFLEEQSLPVQVSFAHHPIARCSEYEERLQCPVQFRAEHNALTVTREFLHVRSRFADATMHATLHGWLGDCTSAMTVMSDSLVYRTMHAICGRLDQGVEDERAVVDVLAIGKRTFQRRLQQEGFTYRRLVDRVRAKTAIYEMLRGDPPLSHLGAQVGFAEQSSFCRAFRKWTGRSPTEFRRLLPREYGASRA